MKNLMSNWTKDNDVITLMDYKVLHDETGPFVKLSLHLPTIRRGIYYRPFQKYPLRPPTYVDWVNGSNRLQAMEFVGMDDLMRLNDGGMMLTLELVDGRYMTILPLVGQTTMAWLSLENQEVSIHIGCLGSSREALSGELPAFSYAIAEQIYATSYIAWQQGLAHPLVGHTAKLRAEKVFPKMFKYIGWCSWEEFHFTINEEKMLEVIDQIEKGPVPIRYVLIDDGHQQHERSSSLQPHELNSTTYDGMQQSRLVSFEPNHRFPNGWQPIINRIRTSSIRWAGLWLNFNGYWGGIHPENRFNMEDSLVALQDGEHSFLMPKEEFYHSFRFYEQYFAGPRNVGFDFLQIDQQAANLLKYQRGGMDNPVISAANNAKALEAASAQHMETHLNCMAHNAVAIFNTRNSAVTRCSEDYKMGDLLWAKRHIHNSFATIPVLGHTVWGDHDMFHSNDPAAAEAMSVSKALSGGPVYLSDTPAQFNTDVIHPLIYADGELLRPLAPAVPLPDSMLEDPMTSSLAYGVIAPLINRTAAIALFNLTEPTISVSRSITTKDYTQAGAMLQPFEQWEIPDEGLILYDWKNRQAEKLTGSVMFTLEDFDFQLLLLCPIQHGWAIIGRADKYLSSAAVKTIYSDRQELIIHVTEPGEYRIWSEDDALASTLGTISRIEENIWMLVIDAGFTDEQSVCIQRVTHR